MSVSTQPTHTNNNFNGKNRIRLIAHGCWFHPLQESRQRKLFVDGINGDHSTFTPTIINSVTNEDKDEDKDKNEEE